MSLRKFKPQDLALVERNQPELFKVLNSQFADLNDWDKAKVAACVIEFVIVSGGDTDVFTIGDDVKERVKARLFEDDLGI